jgi:molybdopterin adenylyltransferase
MNGILQHICTSEKKGRAKDELSVAELLRDHGLAEDVHAGKWHRQVSLLDVADIEAMRKLGVELKPGAFGENLGVEGIDLNSLGIGSRLRLGDAELEFTQIGKICHHRCAIYYTAGDCIMPRAGVFAEVLSGGTIKTGDTVEVIHAVPRDALQVAVLTVSASSSRSQSDDTHGLVVQEMLSQHFNVNMAYCSEIPSESDQLVELLTQLCDRSLDLILTTSSSDHVEADRINNALRSVVEQELPDLVDQLAHHSGNVTTTAALQQGFCGIHGRTIIVNIPGREVENLGFLRDTITHVVKHVQDHSDHEKLERKRKRDGAPDKRSERVGLSG